ncbi:hypothetical protein K435DRAFT_802311 [Dendrothele bispora CBS 962.96]|uniref:CxC2-like cysteine cluster KDZ transposase-associated domain-containing protein n=1 Tax=Dendrothele bispora (strain CBS 962.96) TaxID=1314807 RepID=A0A4V4HEA5_DENBC|nr:hypothetical protein K435DRAFT_802311 [Dendrothele bispora CBS 962.96]
MSTAHIQFYIEHMRKFKEAFGWTGEGVLHHTALAGTSRSHGNALLQSQETSSDGRRVKRIIVQVEPPSPVKKKLCRQTNDNVAKELSNDLGLGFETFFGRFYDDEELARVVERTSAEVIQDLPLKEWIPYCYEYLVELLHLEVRPVCGLENNEKIVYRCLDCLGGDLKCQACCVKEHQNQPLHIIKKWNGVFFEQNKGQAGEWWEQLLCLRWYPATHLNPCTCTMMEALNHFHVMTLQEKVTTYNYYNGLEKLCNNAGLKKQKGGEMMQLDLWSGQRKGSLRYGVQPVHGMVSSEGHDLALGGGWGYFVEWEPYRQFLLSVTDQQEGFTAVQYRKNVIALLTISQDMSIVRGVPQKPAFPSHRMKLRNIFDSEPINVKNFVEFIFGHMNIICKITPHMGKSKTTAVMMLGRTPLNMSKRKNTRLDAFANGSPIKASSLTIPS